MRKSQAVPLGPRWVRVVRSSVKTGTILHKATPRHNVREVVVEIRNGKRRVENV
jgi:hypothetical protein